MLVTYTLKCEGCDLEQKDFRETPLRPADTTPFVNNRLLGYDLCNGCIERMHRLARVIFSKKMTEAQFAHAIDELREGLAKL